LRYLLLGVLYIVVYLALGQALSGHAVARILVANTLLLLLAASICAVVLRRRREWEGTQRLFWDAFALGLALWCVGNVGFTIETLASHGSWVQWHTMFSLCGGIGPTVALLAFPHRGVRKSSAAGLAIDLLSYAMLMGFIYAYFIMVPTVVPGGGASPQTTLLALVQAQRLILFVGLALAFWFGWNTEWRNTYARLGTGAAIGFFLRLATSDAISTGRYHEGSVYDLAWIVPYLCYLWAAIEAPRSSPDVEAAAQRSGWPSAFISALPVLLTPIIGFSLLRLQPIGNPGDAVRLLLTALATVAGLGLLTLRLSAQSGELQRADARLRLLAAATEQTAELILITRADGAFEHANEACAQALGYARDELTRMTLPDLLERGFERTIDQIGRDVRQKGIWRGTLVHRRKDGSTFPVSSTVVALRNREQLVTHFVGVQRDITEELRLRDQLVHSERLSAVGELIAGVAHEINNPLQTIIGSVELLLETNRGSDQQADLELVRREATRAGQIVRNLLSFVRRSTPDRVEADLNQIARSMAELRGHHLEQRDIHLRLELHDGPLPILVNREEIQQVVLNLVLNSEHAIGERPGNIVLRTGAFGRAHTLDVVDDGPGVSVELRGRIFEPFFTTREVGQGTGLGLSIALGIATAHGGRLELCSDTVPDSTLPSPTSNLQSGACFRLTLPAHAARATAAAPPTPAPSVPATGSKGRRRALIVDDEPPIRMLLSRLLQRREYEVTEAASYAEVKALAPGLSFDVVLCDVRLGDGNGGDCLRLLRSSQPDVARRFVFITGDAAGVAEMGGGAEDLPVLAKPFTKADLDRVLDGIEVGV